MGRGIKAPDGLADRLYALLRSATDPIALKRIQCVYFWVKYGYPPEDIAAMVGYHPNYVKQVLAAFWKEGEAVLQQRPCGGEVCPSIGRGRASVFGYRVATR